MGGMGRVAKIAEAHGKRLLRIFGKAIASKAGRTALQLTACGYSVDGFILVSSLPAVFIRLYPFPFEQIIPGARERKECVDADRHFVALERNIHVLFNHGTTTKS